jgi:hypothetical protein
MRVEGRSRGPKVFFGDATPGGAQGSRPDVIELEV